MKHNIILSIFIFLVTYFPLFGQEKQDKAVRKISIHSIFVQTGVYLDHTTNGTLMDFKALAPQSVLLNNNFTDYSVSRGGSSLSYPFFSTMVGIQYRDRQKTTYKSNPLIRFGIGGFYGTTLLLNLYNTETKVLDTLTSFQTGLVIYVDSVTTKWYDVDYNSEQLRFDVSLIFRTNPEARWSLFAGFGIGVSISIDANTHIYYSDNTWVETRISNLTNSSSNYYSSPDHSASETYKNKNNFGFSTLVPMGLDFRIGKTNEFLKLIHLIFELSPAINNVSIPELHPITNATIQYGLGVRCGFF